MNTQESTIEAVQNRIEYLEAHLHLALWILDGMERGIQNYSQNLDSERQDQFIDQYIDVVPTWKHGHSEMTSLYESCDR